MAKISPFLWFDDNAEEAVNYYVSVFKDSEKLAVTRYDKASAKAAGKKEGSVLTVAFRLDGTDFTALNGGPNFTFNEAVSFVVECDDQAEIDLYWEKLSAHPKDEACGWCKDKFGLSWQIVPKNLDDLIANPAAMAKLMNMKKIDIAILEAAVG